MSFEFKGALDEEGNEFLHPDHPEWYRVINAYTQFFSDNELTTRNFNFPITKATIHQTNLDENIRIFELIESIYTGAVAVSVSSLKKINIALSGYNNKVFTQFVFEKSFNDPVQMSIRAQELLFGNPEIMIFSILDALTEVNIVDNEGIKFVKFVPVKYDDLNDTVKEWIREEILSLSEDSSLLDDALGKLPAEIVKENYSLAHYKREMAKRVNDIIQNVDGPTQLLGLTEEFYNVYLGLSTIEEDGKKFYHLSENIYADGNFTKVPAEALDRYENIKKQLSYSNVFNYPITIIRDQNGDDIEHIKEDLRNFDTLDGTNISEYPFVFLKSTSLAKNIFGQQKADMMSDGWFQKALKWFYDLQTPQQVISKSIGQNYFTFLRSLAKDIFNNDQLTSTIGTQFEEALSADKVKPIFDLIAFDKIVAAKKTFFDNLARETSDTDDTAGELTEEEIENAYNEQVKALKEGKPPELEDPPSEQDIENRQKYFKQCALMLNMPELRDSYQAKLISQYKSKTPYHGRFVTLHSKSREQESMLSSLVSSEQEQTLFELETHKISTLVPKVRLFKVFNNKGDGEREVEFIFNRSSTIDRPDSAETPVKFMDSNFDKGSGVGLKDFSFEFNGTNPAEARNDIKATLTLFFQSFQDFTRTRIGKNNKKYRYVDLVIQPKPDKKGMVDGIEVQSDRQYEPSFYRIRSEVGYVVPSEKDGFTPEEINAIRISNKSFFLNMVDHDISFGKDGTVQIKITYRAYLESLLKHPRLDALASPELISRRIENAQTLTKQFNKRECSVEQIKELQVSLAAQEAVLVKQSLSSIITRLRKRKVIYNTVIKSEDKEFFLEKGFFNKCEFEKGVTDDGSDGADVKLVLKSDLPESSDDFDFIDSGNRSIQFFYFGDLLYTVLDCIYEKENKLRKGVGFDRNSIVLGSFEFEPFQNTTSQNFVYNIADIPISVDFFSRWFVDNVVNQKSTRKTFPVMNFIRNLSNSLIKPALVENCVNRKLETRLRFQTAQVTAFEPNGKNPLLSSYSLNPSRKKISLDVESLRTSKILPFKGGPQNDADSNFKDFHTFIVVSALGSTLSYAGEGKYEDDIKQGRFHVHVGQNAGLVKTLSLSKSDQQYIREARFFQNGIDGLLQLSAVYVANIEMFGNTLFYPGMEIFFNPYGIGGDADFDPREAGSTANKLGIGGYHTITSVKSTISPGKFSTSIAAQQYYSGDGSGNPNIVKQRNADRKTGSIESYSPSGEKGEDGFKNCNQVILDAQNYAFEEGTLAGQLSESSTTAPIETAATEETVEESKTESSETPPTETETVEDPEAVTANPEDAEETTAPSETTTTTSSEPAEPEEDTVVVTEETLQQPPRYRFNGEYIKSGVVTTSRSGSGSSQSFQGVVVKGFFIQEGDLIVFFSNDGSINGEVVESETRIFSREEEVRVK